MTRGERRMEVCLATKGFYPVYVGPALRFMRYSPGLRQRGIELSVFTQQVTAEKARRDGLLNRPAGERDAAAERSVEPPELAGLDVSRAAIPKGRWTSKTYFDRLADHCCARRDRVSAVQYLNVDLWSIPCTRRLRKMGIGTVFTYTLLSELSQKPWKRQVQRLHRRLQIDHVDHVVVSSSVMKAQLESLGVSSPIRIIPNGVDTDRYRPPAGADEKLRLRKELGLGADWKIILAVGPVSPRKGVDVLVEAFARLATQDPACRLVLVGPRHDVGRPDLAEFREAIQRSIREANVKSRVVFIGPSSNVVDYMKAADVFAFTSRREGMPNVVPEAMACQLPIVMTPFQGLPSEFGVAEREYLLSSWDTAKLASDLLRAASSKRLRDDLGSAARRWTEQNLDFSKSIDEYSALYRDVARRRRVAVPTIASRSVADTV